MAEFKIDSVDRNLAISTEIPHADVRFYDIRRAPFQIYGLYRPQTEPVFKRLPDEVSKNTGEGVAHLCLQTAGGRVRFTTDSPYLVVHAVMSLGPHRLPHMPLSGSAGFDLYEEWPDGSARQYVTSFIPPLKFETGYTLCRDLEGGKRMRCLTLNFPLYDMLDALYIGIAEDATLQEGAPYLDAPPIVYYGSSITQGGCASRPGNCYQSRVSRAIPYDYLNLGFSGNAKGEQIIVDYMASLSMSAFVCDYDHNAPDAEHLVKTHRNMYQCIRKQHPDIPYIMLSKPDFYHGNVKSNIQRRNVILDTYHAAVEQGDDHVYFIDGESLFRGPYEDSCTVDGCHPNDLGFALMADAVTAVLKRALH